MHEVEQPLRLALELGVPVLVGVVQHAQPAVGSFQLFRGGLGEGPVRAPTAPPPGPTAARGHLQPLAHPPARRTGRRECALFPEGLPPANEAVGYTH